MKILGFIIGRLLRSFVDGFKTGLSDKKLSEIFKKAISPAELNEKFKLRFEDDILIILNSESQTSYLDAIKWFRNRTGAYLVDSKAHIDAIVQKHGIVKKTGRY